jgi:hypothetical protein
MSSDAFSPKVTAASGARSAKKRIAAYRIEGELLTWKEIAARVGVSVNLAQQRWKRAMAMPGPVTWARLKR